MQKWCIPCEIVREKAVAWMDEELSPAETDIVAEHLDRCEDCSEFVERLESIELRPPKLRFATGDAFWSKMDSTLSDELDAHDAPTLPAKRVTWERVAFVALLLFTLVWGIVQHQQVSKLESIVESQQLHLERMQRIYAQPASPRQQPYVMPAVHIPNRMEL